MDLEVNTNTNNRNNNTDNDNIKLNGIEYINLENAIMTNDQDNIHYITELCENFLNTDDDDDKRENFEKINLMLKQDYGFIVKEGNKIVFDLTLTHFYRQDDVFMRDLNIYIDILVTKKYMGLAKKNKKLHKKFRIFWNKYDLNRLKKVVENEEYMKNFGANFDVLFNDIELKSLKTVSHVFGGNPLKHKTFFWFDSFIW